MISIMRKFNKIYFMVALACVTGSTAFSQLPQVHYSRHHENFIRENRTRSELLNPTQNPYQFKDSAEVSGFLNQIQDQQFEYKHNEANSTVEIFNKGNLQHAVAQIPITSRDELLSYRPSKLHERMKDAARSAYGAGRAGVKHTTLNLPVEATIFYMAIGSVVAFNMVSQYGSNPAGLSMFHDQQASAVGVTSLFLFLAAQNATSNVASVFITNPKWHVMLPYIGMIVGAMAQNYGSALMTDPNIKSCINQWFKGKTETDSSYACDKAYEYFTLQKPWEYAPGITSMLISASIAGSTQFALSSAALAAERQLAKGMSAPALRQVARISMVRIAGFVNPGSVPFMTVSGIWLYLTKASNLAVFAHLDHQIVHGITFAVKNLQESAIIPFIHTIAKSQEQVSKLLEQQIINNWAESNVTSEARPAGRFDQSGLTAALEKLTEQLRTWRMSNIAKVTESHASWQKYLGDFVNRVKATEAYYERFVEESIGHNLKENSKSLSPAEKIAPLWGIPARNIGRKDETYLSASHLVESEQILLATAVLKKVSAIFEQRVERSKVRAGEDYELLQKLQELIPNEPSLDLLVQLKLAKAIQLVQGWLKDQRAKGKTQYTDFPLVQDLLRYLGAFDPKLRPNEWLLAAVERTNKYQSFADKINLDSDKTFGKLSPNTYADVLLWNLTCGALKMSLRTSSTEEVWGFKIRFSAPTLFDRNFLQQNISKHCGTNISNHSQLIRNPVPNLTRIKTEQLSDFAKAIPPNVTDKLHLNLDTQLLQLGFSRWWELNTESEISRTFFDFQDKYVDLTEDFLKALQRNDNSNWNVSGVAANGLLVNIRQQLRLYLLVLNSIVQSEGQKQGHFSEIKVLSNSQTSQAGRSLPNANGIVRRAAPILQIQSFGSYTNYSEILKLYPIADMSPDLKRRAIVKFDFESKIEDLFSKLEAHLKNFKVVTIDGKKRVLGPAQGTNQDQDMQELERVLEDLGVSMGVAKLEKTDAETRAKALTVSDSQKELIVFILEQIQSLGLELQTYTSIINAVNWNELNKKHSDERTLQLHNERLKKIMSDFQKGSLIGSSSGPRAVD